jgi:CysZ protein
LLFISLGNIITAPFNEEISQKVEHIITEGTVKYEVGFWKDAFISIKSEVQKILFYLSFLFLIFLLNFIPVAGNTLSFILGTVFSFYFNAFDFLDYPMTRKMLKFRQKLKITNSEKYITFGFGAAAFILMFLPIVNVFLKPVLVTAGTSLYYNKYYILNNN